MIQVTNLIGNMEPVGDEPRMSVIDPATGAQIGSVPEGAVRDVDRAAPLVDLLEELSPIMRSAS